MTVARLNATIGNAFLRSDGPVSSLTLHVDTRGEALDGTNGPALIAAFEDLIHAIDGIYSVGCDATALIRSYDLNDPSVPGNPREAVYTGETAFTPGTDTLPGEVSLNVSYRAARESGVPAQRFRGAVQLGPLATAALDETTGRIAGGAVSTVDAAFTAFAAAVDAADCDWVVGSEASGWKVITTAYITNEFGTVGSRQMTASGSSTITLP